MGKFTGNYQALHVVPTSIQKSRSLAVGNLRTNLYLATSRPKVTEDSHDATRRVGVATSVIHEIFSMEMAEASTRK